MGILSNSSDLLISIALVLIHDYHTAFNYGQAWKDEKSPSIYRLLLLKFFPQIEKLIIDFDFIADSLSATARRCNEMHFVLPSDGNSFEWNKKNNESDLFPQL